MTSQLVNIPSATRAPKQQEGNGSLIIVRETNINSPRFLSSLTEHKSSKPHPTQFTYLTRKSTRKSD